MTDKKKVHDSRVWQRMGLELVLLDALISEIHVDKEFCAVMDMKTWDRLFKVSNHVKMLRAECESRMAKYIPDWDTKTFYPNDRTLINEILESVRQELKDSLPAPPMVRDSAVPNRKENSNE